MSSENGQLPDWLGRLLCLLGLHDFRLVESIGGFGVGGQVEKAEADGNYNACAQLMRQRLQAHGMLRDRIVLSAESQLSDEQLIERLAGGDPERLAAARVLLGAAEGFPETFDETRP